MPNEIKRTDLTRFYEEIGAKYPEEEVVYRDLRGKLRKKFILSYLDREKGSFLDLGCNAGLYLVHFRGKKAVGVDISPSVLQRSRKRCTSLPQSTRYFFVAGDAENLNFLRDVQFDFILCSEVLEHLFHPQKVLDGIARLLKPGGRALITTPNYRRHKPTWVPLKGELRAYVTTGNSYYHTAYRPEELLEMTHQARLQVLECGTLEWEVKYATKLPVIIFRAIRFLNSLFFRSLWIDLCNQRMFERFTLACYYLAHSTRLERLLRPLIREGVRSYILVAQRENV